MWVYSWVWTVDDLESFLLLSLSCFFIMESVNPLNILKSLEDYYREIYGNSQSVPNSRERKVADYLAGKYICFPQINQSIDKSLLE